MGKVLEHYRFDPNACRTELAAFEELLKDEEISEKDSILPFFESHSHLAALVGMLNRSVSKVDLLANEWDVFGDFRADLVVGDERKRVYSLIEFEDARPCSIFAKGRKYNQEWSSRFEHGYSQIIDWFWKLSDYRQTQEFERRFRSRDASFTGTLIIGRDMYLDESMRTRLAWRSNHVIVDSQKVRCLTFDQLYQELVDYLEILGVVSQAEDGRVTRPSSS